MYLWSCAWLYLVTLHKPRKGFGLQGDAAVLGCLLKSTSCMEGKCLTHADLRTVSYREKKMQTGVFSLFCVRIRKHLQCFVFYEKNNTYVVRCIFCLKPYCTVHIDIHTRKNQCRVLIAVFFCSFFRLLSRYAIWVELNCFLFYFTGVFGVCVCFWLTSVWVAVEGEVSASLTSWKFFTVRGEKTS